MKIVSCSRISFYAFICKSYSMC